MHTLFKEREVTYTVRVDSLPHRKWKETKLQPGIAGPGNILGCCLISFHFQWAILSTSTVQPADIGLPTGNGKKLSCTQAQFGQATGLAVA